MSADPFLIPRKLLLNTKLSRIILALCFAIPGVIADAKAAVCDPALAPRASGPQVSDTHFSPGVSKPAYAAGSGATEDLGRAFGIQMTNSFATDATCTEDEYLFERADGSLGDHPVTHGGSDSERIDYVRTFTGQAFWLTRPGAPILTLKPGSVVLLPVEAREFSNQTPRIPGDGLLQGAVLEHGKGRVAVFGEAAMFSAQVSGEERRPMGMNMPGAEQNPQFLLNIMHWLAGLLPGA